MALKLSTSQAKPEKRVPNYPYLGQENITQKLVFVRYRQGDLLYTMNLPSGDYETYHHTNVVPLNKGDQIILTQED